MKILALEFSTDHRSVAVMECGADAAPRVLGRASLEVGRDTRPLGLIDAALAEAGVDREQMDRLAVGLGPGSYTGIRMSIALARGWQLARPIGVVGVGSLECMAFQVHQARRTGVLHLCVDAQQGEFYAVSYDLGGEWPRVIEPLRIVTRAELERLSGTAGLLAGPGMNRMFPAGLNLVPEAATVGWIAAGLPEADPDTELEPVYLRPTAFAKAPPPRFVP